jgi:hypothetical protein
VASVEWDRRGCGSWLGRRWLHTPGGSGDKKDAEKEDKKDEKQQEGKAGQVQGKVSSPLKACAFWSQKGKDLCSLLESTPQALNGLHLTDLGRLS